LLAETIVTVNATNLKKAHALIESDRGVESCYWPAFDQQIFTGSNCSVRTCNHTFVADPLGNRDDFCSARKSSDEFFLVIGRFFADELWIFFLKLRILTFPFSKDANWIELKSKFRHLPICRQAIVVTTRPKPSCNI
jgi:hypothetical protein